MQVSHKIKYFVVFYQHNSYPSVCSEYKRMVQTPPIQQNLNRLKYFISIIFDILLPNSLISWENLPIKKSAWMPSRKQKLNKFQIIYSAAHNWSSKLPNHHQKPIGNSFHLKLPAIIFSTLSNFFAIYPNQCSNFNSINPNTHRHILRAPAAAFLPFCYPVCIMYVYILYIRN